ncbi:MAG: acetylglutamate kinase [Firmicutes bacterium]|nr:acetylglutamate kinase [Bacillota bacterium]MCM1401125.1 acetylglutamate kinase [Bacteroides sp.]MCM1477052.1 acetylglutamate kinase [Bacteroides sp.]
MKAAHHITVVKIGGNIVNDSVALTDFLKKFSSLKGRKILVHGGGREATALAAALNIKTTMIEGRRVTDADTLSVVTMIYAGLINKRIVSMLQSMGCNAIGLTGADAKTITSVRRPAEPVDFGFVGDLKSDSVNHHAIMQLMECGLTPVFCAITCTAEGQLLNSNADTVASEVACAMSEVADVKLIYCFEKDGVLSDANDDSSVIPIITPESFNSLKNDGVINGGMIPKITNAIKAVERGVECVIIKSAAHLCSPSSGTIIKS